MLARHLPSNASRLYLALKIQKNCCEKIDKKILATTERMRHRKVYHTLSSYMDVMGWKFKQKSKTIHKLKTFNGLKFWKYCQSEIKRFLCRVRLAYGILRLWFFLQKNLLKFLSCVRFLKLSKFCEGNNSRSRLHWWEKQCPWRLASFKN